MYKRLKTSILVFLITGITIFSFSGCSGVNLSDEKEKLVVEYAVNVVINHDKNYIVKMDDRLLEEESTTWIYDDGTTESQTEPVTDENGDLVINPGEEEETTDGGNYDSVNTAFGLDGLTVTGAGYSILTKYPDDNEGFSMVATTGNKLIVMKFNVANNTLSDVSVNMMDLEYKYRCIIDEDTILNAQITALLDGFNTWIGTLKPGESEDLVLIFQVSDEAAEDLGTIKLAVVKSTGVSTALISE